MAYSTPGARKHASEDEILDMASRLISGDWGNMVYQEDIAQNEHKASLDTGLIFGIYTAQDGAQLWATQGNRFTPPTIMLPEER